MCSYVIKTLQGRGQGRRIPEDHPYIKPDTELVVAMPIEGRLQ